jgi:ribosomal protein L12E/L44/L45/RPP1/RPP2
MCVNFIVVPAKVYAADETDDETQHIEPPTMEADTTAPDDTMAFYEAAAEESQSDAAPIAPPASEQPPVTNSITPDGQGEVLDRLANGDNIEFITIATPSGNVFYLIIDHARPNNNVYFLNSANEWDLMALAAEAGLAVPPHMAQAPTAEPAAVEKELPTVSKPAEPEPKEKEPEENESGGGAALFIFLAIAGAAGFGVVYYLKIYKPKREREMYGGEDSEETESDDFEDADDDGGKEGGDSHE